MTQRLIVVDDHPLLRAALVQVLSSACQIREAGDLEQLSRLLAIDDDVDLVLLDLDIPGAIGLSGLLQTRARYPELPVLVLSASDSPDMPRRCRELGAAGFLGKSAAVTDLRTAVETILSGGTWPPSAERRSAEPRPVPHLTAQQMRVLDMMSAGLMNKQIAHKLGISEATVKVHVSAVLRRLGVRSRTQAVIWAQTLRTVHTASLPDDDAP